MKSKAKVEVAIVEDNALLATTLRDVVESSAAFSCAAVWTTGEQALEEVADVGPQVVLIDINLPGVSGIEVTALMKQRHPDIKIIIVTVYRNHDKIFAALKAGASGYLLKRSQPAEIRSAIESVLAGGAPMSPEIASRIVESFHRSSRPAPEDNHLSPRESEILELIGAGLSNKDIGAQLGISWETVRSHVKKILEKLHARTRTEAAMKHRGSCDPDSWL